MVTQVNTPNHHHPQEHKNKKLFPSRNRFEVLSQMEQSVDPHTDDVQSSALEPDITTINKPPTPSNFC